MAINSPFHGPARRLKSINKSVHCAAIPSAEALREYFQADPKRARDVDPNDSWAGNMSRSQAIAAMGTGDEELAARSDKLLSEMEGLLDLSSMVRRAVPAMAGGVPNVPAYLSGNPAAMRRRQAVQSEATPVAVVCSTSMAARVNGSTGERRGVTVLALVRALSMVRPVRLFAFCGFVDNLIKTATFLEIQTAPLDVARAAYILAHPAFHRTLFYGGLENVIRGREAGDMTGLPLLTGEGKLADLASEVLEIPEVISIGRLDNNGDFGTDTSAADWLKEKVQAHGFIQ